MLKKKICSIFFLFLLKPTILHFQHVLHVPHHTIDEDETVGDIKTVRGGHVVHDHRDRRGHCAHLIIDIETGARRGLGMQHLGADHGRRVVSARYLTRDCSDEP